MADDAERDEGPAGEGRKPPEPQGHLAGIPYDLRPPTIARARARLWNRDDPRLLTPKTFGWGYDVNFYWLAHPGAFMKARRRP